MAYNPFLSMNEPVAPMAAEALNPFMLSDTENADLVTGDNPFAANNPFSDLGGGFEPSVSDSVPVDIFGTAELSNTGAHNLDESIGNTSAPFDIFGPQTTDIDRLVKPTELELITTVDSVYINQDEQSTTQSSLCPVPPETQNLILSVTGQMEFASSHLLDRIPPTRTPSPVSVRDIHSPSPTPEPEIIEEQTTVDTFDINRNKPTRPPPARPPPVPRPPPPRPAPPPQISQTQHSQPPQLATAVQTLSDEINLFDAPVPVAVKPTKEAILSLYSLPVKKEEKQIDFLSDDILEEMPTKVASEDVSQNLNEVATNQEQITSSDYTEDELVSTPKEPVDSKVSINDSIFPVPLSEPMDTSEPLNETSAFSTTPSPFAAPDTIQNQQINEPDLNPFESSVNDDSSEPYVTTSVNIFGASEDICVAKNVEAFGTEIPNITHQNQVATDVEMTQKDSFSTETGETFGSNAVNDFAVNETDAFVSQSHIPTTDTDWGIPKTTEPTVHDNFPDSQDAFDAFSAKFDSTSTAQLNAGAWGDTGGTESGPGGFESEAFDPFLSMGAPPPPAATPRLDHQGSCDSTDDTFSVFIKPKENEWSGEEAAVPALAPPPRPQAFAEPPRVNPFDQTTMEHQHHHHDNEHTDGAERGGEETPPTPLFDEDVSMPLEDFPRTTYAGPGWEMQLRQPNKKKITGQRFWKKIFVRLAYQGDNPVVQLLNSATDKEPFQELPLQACYSVSEIGAQQFDQFGKIFTVKLQYVFYKERPGVRPGQVTKAERITNKLSQFAAYAIQGDYQGVKEFGSDLRKLGLPVEHAPQVSQLFKLGSLVYEDVKQFSCSIEEALFKLAAHRDRALTYKMEEVQITAVDELYVEQDAEGSVLKQIARVRLFFLGFLSGMPDVELGVNDLRRQGREVVGRHDIIPVATEEWIRVEAPEFHACVQPEEFNNTQIIKFKPPDACYIELMRFRVRPPKNRELPLQLKASWCVTGNKVELRADVLVPGFASRKLGQVPCEDVSIRFPIPECWIYLFRVEKHFRYGSVKSAHRRTGKIKGIERFLGAVDTLQESLIEVTSGQAKYEHQHRAIVWRMPRLPKEGQGAYTTHNLVSRMALTSYDQIPEELARWARVEFTMPATQVSHTTVRSVSLQNHDSDEPPEKYVRYLARHEYQVGIERTSGQAAPAYALTTAPAAPPAPTPAPVPAPPSSDSDSD